VHVRCGDAFAGRVRRLGDRDVLARNEDPDLASGCSEDLLPDDRDARVSGPA